jgi:hypothetical protein
LRPSAARNTRNPTWEAAWKEIAMLVLNTQEKQEGSSFHQQLIGWWVDLWARLRRNAHVEAQDEKRSKQGPRGLIL